MRYFKTLAAAVLVFTIWALFAPAAQARDGELPEKFYLSLGDSMAFGLQFDKLFALLDAGTYTPAAFNTGYSDVFGRGCVNSGPISGWLICRAPVRARTP